MTTPSWITNKAQRGAPSSIAGAGLVAVDFISAGELVGVKNGRVLTQEEFLASPAFSRHTEMQINDDTFVAAYELDEVDDSMMYINHSCDPSIGHQGINTFFALRDIAPGEELLADYGASFTYDDFKLEGCQCGSEHCRGTITNRDWLLPEVRERLQGYFPDFVKYKLHDIGDIMIMAMHWLDDRVQIRYHGDDRVDFWNHDGNAGWRGNELHAALTNIDVLRQGQFAALLQRNTFLLLDAENEIDANAVADANAIQRSIDRARGMSGRGNLVTIEHDRFFNFRMSRADEPLAGDRPYVLDTVPNRDPSTFVPPQEIAPLLLSDFSM